MHIKINDTSYSALRSVTFAPQTDVTGATLPINEFSADIITADDIAIGQDVELKDGRGNLWAKYSIIRADRVDEDTVRVVAQSPIMLLGDTKMPSVMYSDASATTVLQQIILNLYSSVGSGNYTVDSAFNSAKINGYAPEQTPRERLQWVCYALGAYVKTYFGSKINILKVDDTPTLIPMEKTFWKPTVSYNDYVTAVKGYSFAFAEGDPETTDEWVEDATGGKTYIVTRSGIMLEDVTVPSGARENIVELDDVMLVNSSNASAVMANVAAYQFCRAVVDLDVINNGEYMPGMLVQFYVDEETIMQGYIQSCAFKFGLQARCTLHIIGGVEIETADLTVTYKFGNRTIDKQVYALPVGYAYSIDNPWFDVEIKGHRYVLRPLTASVTGTMTSSGATVTVNYEAALDLYEGTLTISNVDGITTETEDDKVIGVIE